MPDLLWAQLPDCTGYAARRCLAHLLQIKCPSTQPPPQTSKSSSPNPATQPSGCNPAVTDSIQSLPLQKRGQLRFPMELNSIPTLQRRQHCHLPTGSAAESGPRASRRLLSESDSKSGSSVQRMCGVSGRQSCSSTWSPFRPALHTPGWWLQGPHLAVSGPALGETGLQAGAPIALLLPLLPASQLLSLLT